MAITMLRPRAAFQRFGCSKSDGYNKISRGLLPPFISIGPRSKAMPEHEVDAINAALIAGRSEDELRKLVSELMAARGSSDRDFSATSPKARPRRDARRPAGALE